MKKNLKALFRSDIFEMVKRGYFEVLRKKSSTITDVVWTEESKNGLQFEIRPSYDDAPMTSHFVTDGKSSCRHPPGDSPHNGHAHYGL